MGTSADEGSLKLIFEKTAITRLAQAITSDQFRNDAFNADPDGYLMVEISGLLITATDLN